MKIFFDFEFIEDGPQRMLDPISVGMIREDGKTYYAIWDNIPWGNANEWVLENIKPDIDNQTNKGLWFKSNKQIRQDIIEFVGTEEKVEFWGYFCSYDWVLLAMTMGRMIDLPNNWPMHPMDLKQWMVHLGVKREDLNHIPNEQEHNALSDAIWNRSVYKRLFVTSRFHPEVPAEANRIHYEEERPKDS